VQKNTLLKFEGSNVIIVTASFIVFNVIAKQGKAFCDGEYIKDLMLETALFLFEKFANKGKIIKRIKDLPMTRNTGIKCTTEKITSSNSLSRYLSNAIFV